MNMFMFRSNKTQKKKEIVIIKKEKHAAKSL